MARLTEKQRQQIIADRVEGMSERKIAAKHGVSQTTVHNALKKAEPETVQKVSEKKQAITLDMFKYMDEQKGNAQKLLSNIVEALNDPEKLRRANVRDLATAYGIIFDKFTQAAPKESDEVLKQAREILGQFDGAIK